MKTFLFTLFLGITSYLQAQNTLNGTITDSSGQLLEHVDIYIEELQKGTSTNNEGVYLFTNLPDSPIKITISLIGYQKEVQLIQLTSPNTTLNFTLKETVFKMDEIIISTPFNRLQSENVMKVEKASLEQLEKNGGLTLMNGLNSLQGVSQVSTGMGIGKPVIRGLRGNRVLVYNIGLRLENQQFGDEHGLGVDDFSIESVEVIKGPASLLYGSDAMGGVLYFNPSRFTDENNISYTAGTIFSSNTSGNRTFVNFKKSFELWKFLINAGTTEHSDFKTPDKLRVSNSRFNEKSISGSIGFNNNAISSTLRVHTNSSEVGIPHGVEIQNSMKTPIPGFQHLNSTILSFQNVFFLQNSRINTTLGYTLNQRKEFEDEHDIEEHHSSTDDLDHLDPALFLKLKTWSLDAKWHLPKIQDLETVLGLQHSQQQNKNLGEEILIPSAEKNDIGLFLTSTLEKENYSLQGGIRFDSRKIKSEEHRVTSHGTEKIFIPIDKNYNSISGSLGLKSSIFSQITTRLNLASGFKAPNLAELTSNGVHHGTNRYEVGNADLDTEKNFQVDLALEYQQEHIELFANGFYNFIDNYIFVSPTGEFEDGNPIFHYKQENAKLYGGEFGMHLHPHPLDWLHLKTAFDMVIGKQENGAYLPLIPAHKLSNTIRAEFMDKKWIQKSYAQVVVEHVFKQSKVSSFETNTNGYQLVNLSFGATIPMSKKKLDISLNLNNAFNKTYIDHLSRLKPDGLHNIGRNFVLSVKFKH